MLPVTALSMFRFKKGDDVHRKDLYSYKASCAYVKTVRTALDLNPCRLVI